MLNENLTRAAQTATLLADDLLALHSEATSPAPHGQLDPILGILLRQLLADARELESKLLEIDAVRNG